MKKRIITISREFGSGGRFIGIVDVDKNRADELMNDSGIDFVLDGGCVPKNMKDLNILSEKGRSAGRG